MRGGFGADIAAGAGPVVDNELLAEPPRQGVGHKTRDDVGRGPCRITGDDVNGA
jgi:hypothetical protein